MKAFALLLATFCVSPALAQSDSGSITGPVEVRVGERLILKSDEAGEWDLGALPDSQYMIVDGGKTVCVWTLRSRTIRVVLVVARTNEGEGVTLVKSVHLVEVKGKPVGPIPDPDPDDVEGDAKAVYDLLMKSRPPKGESGDLADNYFDIAVRLASGDLKADAVMAKTVELNRADVKDRDKWLPFFTAMQSFLSERGFAGDGSKKSAADYQSTWMSIGGGLRAYSKRK